MTEYEKKLIEDNMNAVAMTTWQFLKHHNIPRSEFDDYCQTGYLVLCNKVHKYDGSTKFSTFIDVVLRRHCTHSWSKNNCDRQRLRRA